MRRLATLALLALATFSAAVSAKYDLLMDDTKIGSAVLSFEILPDGGTKFITESKIDFRGDKISQRTEERYDKDSRPVWSQIVEVDAKLKSEWRLAYGKDALIVTTVKGGKKSFKAVAYPKGKSIVKPSQTWFFISTPMPGAVSKEWSYDVRAGQWRLEVRRYVGRTEIEFKGKKIQAYELQDSRSDGKVLIKQWVDGKGMPLVVGSGGEAAAATMRLERTN